MVAWACDQGPRQTLLGSWCWGHWPPEHHAWSWGATPAPRGLHTLAQHRPELTRADGSWPSGLTFQHTPTGFGAFHTETMPSSRVQSHSWTATMWLVTSPHSSHSPAACNLSTVFVSWPGTCLPQSASDRQAPCHPAHPTRWCIRSLLPAHIATKLQKGSSRCQGPHGAHMGSTHDPKEAYKGPTQDLHGTQTKP